MNLKRHHIIIFLIVLVVIIALFYFFKTPKTIAPDTTSVATTTSDSFTYTTKTISEENKEKSYTIKAIYPVFSLKNGETEKNLNDNVALLVNQEISSYKTSFDETSNPNGQYGVSTFSLTFKIDLNNTLKNILPMRFTEAYYSAGAAHPGAVIVTANYDLSSGSPVSLVSLFRPGSQYFQVLSSYSIDTLKERFGPDANQEFINDGAAPKENNFEAFLITDQGLLIIFNEYQVAPYAAGAQEVLIPWGELKNILNPSGAVRSKINS